MSIELLFGQVEFGGPLPLILSYLGIKEITQKMAFVCRSFHTSSNTAISYFSTYFDLKDLLIIFNPNRGVGEDLFERVVHSHHFKVSLKCVVYGLRKGFLKSMKDLFKKVENVHIDDELILRTAAEKDRFEEVKNLVEDHGCNFHIYRDFCLQCAFSNGNIEMYLWAVESRTVKYKFGDLISLRRALIRKKKNEYFIGTKLSFWDNPIFPPDDKKKVFEVDGLIGDCIRYNNAHVLENLLLANLKELKIKFPTNQNIRIKLEIGSYDAVVSSCPLEGYLLDAVRSSVGGNTETVKLILNLGRNSIGHDYFFKCLVVAIREGKLAVLRVLVEEDMYRLDRKVKVKALLKQSYTYGHKRKTLKRILDAGKIEKKMEDGAPNKESDSFCHIQ